MRRSRPNVLRYVSKGPVAWSAGDGSSNDPNFAADDDDDDDGDDDEDNDNTEEEEDEEAVTEPSLSSCFSRYERTVERDVVASNSSQLILSQRTTVDFPHESTALAT